MQARSERTKVTARPSARSIPHDPLAAAQAGANLLLRPLDRPGLLPARLPPPRKQCDREHRNPGRRSHAPAGGHPIRLLLMHIRAPRCVGFCRLPLLPVALVAFVVRSCCSGLSDRGAHPRREQQRDRAQGWPPILAISTSRNVHFGSSADIPHAN